MILQALSSYYERIATDSSKSVALPGFSTEGIDFSVRLDKSGKLLDVVDLRELKGKKLTRKPLIVPKPPQKRTSGKSPYFAWDKTDYVFGCTVDKEGQPVLTPKHFDEFKKLLKNVGGDSHDDGIRAVICFAESWKPENAQKLANWPDVAGKNVVFQLDGEFQFVHDRPAVKQMWIKHFSNTADAEASEAMCLVTGNRCKIARLHPAIFGVANAHTAGAGIVTFNKDKTAFTSYGKEQNLNAPVGMNTAFSYATALNFLLRAGSKQKIQIGDATTAFWAEKSSPVEGFFGMVLDPRDTSAEEAELRTYLQAVKEGKFPSTIDPATMFYVLGLSPNGPRLSVRYWHASTVKDISEKIGQHFRDLSMVRSFDSDPEYPGMWHLLKETSNQKSEDGPTPLLGGAVMQAILNGTLYPQELLAAVIGRIRAEQSSKDKNGKPRQNVNYLRAAIIKAVLARKNRILNHGMEISMALDKENRNIAYLLGRLFAVLEKAQQDAIPGANTTIKDRFYGSASATPRVVFPQLLRLAQHHIEKAEYGRFRDKQIEEIIGNIPEFPAHMGLDQQGLFAIGYYHQRQDFKKNTN
ncbi:MAG: type I-C CRISPR-associated protein Cas8c/Csd1 [Phycisphaerae bacterium]|nr:type I-C CRISPR-associated protein Cas8c/Csd1 [Phycisphaerae bacterium]